jgi:hypothetical protein
MSVTTKNKTTNLLPRRCKYCRCTFVPERAQDKNARFCCPNHRKAYWRYGGLPYDKMREQIMRDVRKIVREEIDAIFPKVEGQRVRYSSRGAIPA